MINTRAGADKNRLIFHENGQKKGYPIFADGIAGVYLC